MANETHSSRQRSGEASRHAARQDFLPWLFGVLAFAAIYFASAKLGLSLAFMVEQISPVWPPSGIALAGVLLFGFRFWPGILLGAFLANATANEPILTAVGIAVGNTLEAVAGAWLLRRFIGFDNALERVRDAIGLIVLAAALGTMISATIGVTSLCLSGVFMPSLERTIQWSDFGSFWWVWWVGDAMGVLVAAPPLLTLYTARRAWPSRRPAEAFALFAGLVTTCSLIFVSDLTTELGQASLAYLVFPYVIWAALRLGQPATTCVTLIAASLMIWATLHNYGPFGMGPVHERLLLLQVFIGVVAISALLLGAALAERRQAETEVRRSEADYRFLVEELKEVDRQKDEFLATLAHELRNPLSPIRTGVDLMRLDVEEHSEFQDVLGILDRQVQQLTRLVDDLLDVSRVTRGKISLQLQTIDFAAIIARAIETSRPLLDERGHQFAVVIPSDPLCLEADPTRLAQVFANVLNNAAKYTERGGRIDLQAVREDKEIVVRISDTGQGIEAAMLPRIFELFAQADRSLSRSAGGLGIGLTLVKRLVEAHGGSVQAFSEGPGKGSEFVIRLPLAHEESVTSAPLFKNGDSSGASATARHILVVDDNVDAARTLTLLLKAAGYLVHTAHSGAEALALVASHQPQVVLLDIGLPEMNGYEVARRIREQTFGKEILLIALTGWGQPEDRQRATEAGFNHHLTKPVEHTVLMDLLTSALAETYSKSLAE
jgi:signal transduction histidine kinase/ActR/RegA family two-component response regulator